MDIYSALKRASIPFTARVVGDGPLKTDIMNSIKRKELDHHVKLVGSLEYDDVLGQYAWADLFIFTGGIAVSGDRDGFPNVIPEAMASGVPVITVPNDAIKEVLANGLHCIMLSRDDSNQWPHAIRRLMNDDEYYQKISDEAHSLVTKEFDAKSNIKDLLVRFQNEVRTSS